MTRASRHLSLLMLSPLLFACTPDRDFVPSVVDGDAERGRAALARHECGVCHVIPGVANAIGKVGPALDRYSHRSYVAGKFPNEPDTLVRWIIDAPAMAPRTAMPAIAMSDREARDMAAYLYESD